MRESTISIFFLQRVSVGEKRRKNRSWKMVSELRAESTDH